MADAQRHAADDLSPLLAQARTHDFFQLLERIHAALDALGIESEAPRRQRIRFSSSASLAFPASDVVAAESWDTPGVHACHVRAAFFGLHGTDSPLPTHYLDRIAYDAGQGQGIRPAFFDFANHIVLDQLYRAWRKYRYYARFRPGATDAISQGVFALIGLGHAATRGASSIAWGRLLSFSGTVALRSRSADMVAGLIAHCLDLTDVRLHDFEPRTLDLHEDDIVRLGSDPGRLGQDFLLGTRMRTHTGKFTVRIGDLDRRRYDDFLPAGKDFPRLQALVDFLLRDPMACDVELTLRADDDLSFRLAADQPCRLGWTTRLAPTLPSTPSVVRLTLRA